MILVNLPGIRGDSKIPGHVGEIEFDTYRFGNLNRDPDAGRNSVLAYDLILTKRKDSSSPRFMEFFMSGKQIPRGEMLVVSRIPGTEAKQSLLYGMEDLFISYYLPKVVHDPSGSIYTEDIGINFKKVMTAISRSGM